MEVLSPFPRYQVTVFTLCEERAGLVMVTVIAIVMVMVIATLVMVIATLVIGAWIVLV